MPAAKGGHPLSDHVMAGLDEVLTQQRLAREKAAEDQVEVGATEEIQYADDCCDRHGCRLQQTKEQLNDAVLS